MGRTLRLVFSTLLVLMPLLSVNVALPAHVAAADANDRCDQREEGDYQTRYPNTGGAKFIWRGGKIEASIVLLQDRCSCSGHEDIVDPITGVVTEGPCNEWRWREQAGFDRSKSPVFETNVAFDKPKLMQLGANGEWGRVCPSPWHDTRGVYLPDWDGLDNDFRGDAQEEYHVGGHIFVRRVERHWNGRSFCEPTTTTTVRTIVNDKHGSEIAIRWEERFDIEGAVRAAVAGLPYDQVRIGANPPGQPDGIRPEYRGLVGAPTYFWLEGADGPQFNGFRVAAPGWDAWSLSAWVVVYPAEITWDFGDGTTLTTTSRGVPWPEAEPNGPHGLPHDGAVSKTYEYAGTFQATARVTWTARWGLYEEHTTLCSAAPPTPCSPFIPIYAAGPVTVIQSRPYQVMEIRSVRTD